MTETRWYPSKMDTWLVVLLAIAALLPLGIALAALIAGQWQAALAGLLPFAFLIALYAGLVFPMRYGFEAEQLVICFGMARRRVPLAAIREVHPTSNPLSSPALSLDRLHVQYGDGLLGAVMISPADREGFLTDLAARAGLAREGDRLVRRA
jgi:hypothetical protein